MSATVQVQPQRVQVFLRPGRVGRGVEGEGRRGAGREVGGGEGEGEGKGQGSGGGKGANVLLFAMNMVNTTVENEKLSFGRRARELQHPGQAIREFLSGCLFSDGLLRVHER